MVIGRRDVGGSGGGSAVSKTPRRPLDSNLVGRVTIGILNAES